MLFLDGVYVNKDEDGQRFVPVTLHRVSDISHLVNKISLRVVRYLERAGLILRDAENSYLNDSAHNDHEMNEHRSHSITYRIALGPQKGKKVFSLQTVPPLFEGTQKKELLVKAASFSLHAGVAIKAHQRDKLERICRYISRPGLSVHRLSLTQQGNVRYELKTPYRNGTTSLGFYFKTCCFSACALRSSNKIS
jgi:hypothetical protein